MLPLPAGATASLSHAGEFEGRTTVAGEEGEDGGEEDEAEAWLEEGLRGRLAGPAGGVSGMRPEGMALAAVAPELLADPRPLVGPKKELPGSTISAHTARTIGSSQIAFRPGGEVDIADGDETSEYRNLPKSMGFAVA